MKTIVYATDGSAASETAGETVKDYLQAWPEAKVIVLYVTAKENYAYDLIPDVVNQHEAEVTKEIKQKIEKQYDKWHDRFEFAHRTGHPSPTICSFADEKDANLIIIGSHGRGVIDRALLGSVTHSVLNRTKIPVLVVPEQHSK